MKIVKILTFLTLSLFCNITIHADIDYSQKIEFSGGFEKIKISNEGVTIGESASNFPNNYFNGVWHSTKLDMNFQRKVLGGHRITDLDFQNGNIYATTYMLKDDGPGLFKISNNFQKVERIGKKASLNKVHAFKDKVYYGGSNYGAWVVNQDNTNNLQLLGNDGYGPQIDQIKSNSENIYILSRGSLYFSPYNKDSLAQLFPIYRLSNIEPSEKYILATSWDKFLILDLNGKVTFEKQFSNQIKVLKSYQNYIFLTEVSPSEQKIWVSNDLGKNFYESKTKFNSSYLIRDIELTGTENISIFLNFTNNKIIKAKFIFDYDEERFLSLPFKTRNPNDLVDRITSFFDHRYPYLGNQLEPINFAETTLNFYGSELKKPYLYYSSHDGVDYGLPMYSEILAVEKGVANYIYNPGGLGHALIISHPNNYLTVYGHLDESNLITKTTTEVQKGEVIGKVGMSGNTNGPHLHFTIYKGKKELINKVDPFGWYGSFPDPWGTKSRYLWDLNLSKLNQEINLNTSNYISNNNLELKLDLISNQNTYHLTFYPAAPVFDRINFKYKERTSYKLEMKNLLNEKVISFASLRFKGFTNPHDEKKYSIFKYDGENLIRLETMFDAEKNILATYTSLDGQYMVLENGIKKISTKSTFKTTE